MLYLLLNPYRPRDKTRSVSGYHTRPIIPKRNPNRIREVSQREYDRFRFISQRIVSQIPL